MLNLFVRLTSIAVLWMKLYVLLPLVLLLIAAQTGAPVTITSPAAGEVLRGQVTVTGNLDLPRFASAPLDFAYAPPPTDRWFTIRAFSGPIVNSSMTVWDTTLITDGDYILRLRVDFEDGTFQEVTVRVK